MSSIIPETGSGEIVKNQDKTGTNVAELGWGRKK